MKRILITGASRGIGRAIALKLASSEAELMLHGRDGVALGEVCRAAEAKGAKVKELLHDLATPGGVRDLMSVVGTQALNVLVNNAGIAVVKPFAEIAQAEWEQTLAVNLTAPFMLIQHFAPQMKPGSTIVNMLSVASKTGYPNWSAYCMSKFALEGFSQSVREELREHCVRVINVYPAATNTEIWNSVAGEWPREKMMAPEEIADAVAFALSQPNHVAMENITLKSVAGDL